MKLLIFWEIYGHWEPTGGPIDIEQKGWELVIHDYGSDLLMAKAGIYRIVTVVTSDVRVSSTRLVMVWW